HLRSRPKPGIAEPLKAARAALASGDIAAAIRGFEAVRAFERQHVEASLELGRLYVRTGQDAAAARLRSVLEQVPQHLDARVLLSRLLLRSGPPTEAAQSLQALLAIDPGHREGLTMLAELETSRGNFAAATEAWARAWRGERDEAGQEAGEDTGDDTGLTAPAERPLGADLPADAILDRAAQAVVRQRIAAIGRYYTGTYEYYDLLLRQGSLIQDYERQVVRYLLAALDPGQPIVDIGSGFGLMAMVLGLNGRRAFGVEFDPRRAATFAAVLEAVGCRMPAVGANARLVYGAFPSAIAAPIPDGAALVFTNVAAGVPEEELRSNIRALRPHPFVLFDAERFFRKRESEAEIEHLLALFPQEGLPPPQPAFRIPDWNGSYYVIDRRR
ncbi:MAG: tetratricopeptide repeat protein, partial [Thiohalocapsa sp.]